MRAASDFPFGGGAAAALDMIGIRTAENEDVCGHK